MKCENWSNKVNNFVVRKLKSFKLNGQQQVLSSTMPAMPKEKTSPIPLNECNFVQMKMKEQLVGSSGIQAPTQTTTSTGKLITTKMPENILQDCSNTTTMQQQQQQNKSVTPTQTTTTTTKLYSSSCNDICSTNNYTIRRTSANDIVVGNTTIQSSKGKNELITSSPSSMTIIQTQTTLSSLLNGSGGNNGSTTTNLLLNSKNDINNKILSNGITKMNPLSSSVIQSGFTSSSPSSSTTTTTTTTTSLSGNNCCNKINNLSTIKNNGIITTTTQSVTTTTTTTNPNTSSSSGSTSTQSTSSNASIKSNLSAIKNNSNHVSSPSSSSSTSRGSTVGVSVVPPKKTAKDYVFGKIIGEGSFSTVCLARDIHTNREYAIKICYKPHILREKKQEYVRREREIMHIMNNVPGFVNLSCTFQDYRNLYFVMTLAKNGDLLPYINKVGSFDLDCTRHYAAELVLAIENMHKRGVIHRDLKPENILLDENMHTLIADFGSAKVFDVNQYNDTLIEKTTSSTTTTTTNRSSPLRTTTSDSPIHRKSSSGNENNTEDDDDDDNDNDDSPRPIRRRRGSFVGTAQYVSPEVLQGEIVTRSADLWALGCIIYQMISGLPPFRGGSDYLIFKEIMNLNLIFPEGFDKDAEDLVRNLIKLNPKERLGSNDIIGKYESLRKHSFFSNINWDNIRYISPPQIYPYLPGVSKDEELRSHYRVPDNLEPGLDDKQLTRLLGLELGTITGIDRSSSISSSDNTSSSSSIVIKSAAITTTPTTTPIIPITMTTITTTTITPLSSSPSSLLSTEKKTDSKNNINLNLTENEKQRRLEFQKKTDKWHSYADGEIILKKGLINKRKGLFARKRMLLLTTGPRLIYIDPVQMIKKGEIPWSPALRVEPKNFKIFFVHTPNRTYYLEDPEGYALEWVNTIEDVRQKTYGDKS